jgi:hypothetical protein
VSHPQSKGTEKYLTATFESTELATFAEMRLAKSNQINALRFGSGGAILSWKSLKTKEIRVR